MIGESFSGTDECYVCGKTLKWTKIADAGRGSIVVYEVPAVRANAFAIGRNDDGSIKFEIECTWSELQNYKSFCKSINI